MLVAFFAFGVPLWLSPVLATTTLAILFLISLGVITIPQSADRVTIRDLRTNLQLNPELEMKTWWHYVHRGKAFANDIHAILYVKDSQGKEIYFSETIMFETRHPNEAPFRDEKIPDGSTVVQIQRIDRLHIFLNQMSPSEEDEKETFADRTKDL